MPPQCRRCRRPRRRCRGAAALRRIALVAGLALLAAPATAGEVTVFAAASLRDALAEIAAAWDRETGHAVVPALAGTPALARQIREGAPADVFVSASRDWMDALEADGLIAPGTRADIAGNALVVVAHGPDAPPLDLAAEGALAARLGAGRLAMALIDAVPAGVYGKAALTRLGLWDGVAAQVAQADNVRAALRLVALGAAPLGIVYASDAAAEPGVRVVATFPPDSHPPIVYPAAVLARGDTPLAADFLAFLQGHEAQAALARHGFRPAGG